MESDNNSPMNDDDFNIFSGKKPAPTRSLPSTIQNKTYEAHDSESDMGLDGLGIDQTHEEI